MQEMATRPLWDWFLVFSGSGGKVTKTIACVEIQKRSRRGALPALQALLQNCDRALGESPTWGCLEYPRRRQLQLFVFCFLKTRWMPRSLEIGPHQPWAPLQRKRRKSRLRALLGPTQRPPAQPSAKRACLVNWSACSPHSRRMLGLKTCSLVFAIELQVFAKFWIAVVACYLNGILHELHKICGIYVAVL